MSLIYILISAALSYLTITSTHFTVQLLSTIGVAYCSFMAGRIIQAKIDHVAFQNMQTQAVKRYQEHFEATKSKNSKHTVH